LGNTQYPNADIVLTLTKTNDDDEWWQLPVGWVAVLLAGPGRYWLSSLFISPSSTTDVAAAAAVTAAADDDDEFDDVLAASFFVAAFTVAAFPLQNIPESSKS